MKLVIGGAHQGKLKFSLELAGQQEEPAGIADGGQDSFEAAFVSPVVYRLHCYIRRLLEAGENEEQWLKSLMERNPQAILIMDEIGYGIVPVDAFQRRYRETVGTCGQILSANACEVYRVICGIGTQIK